MGTYRHKMKPKTVKVGRREENVPILENDKFEQFDSNILGLGSIRQRSKHVEAIAAVFDLSGFTSFCSQVDPHLAVPEYLGRFLDWLFEQIRNESIRKSYGDGKTLWLDLPFLAKFLGDGVLFLWDTAKMSPGEIGNVVATVKNICGNYKDDFYPQIRRVVVAPPNALRGGVARGRVFSVGNGEDYVGPCINIATRLQKLCSLTFCVAARGFDFERLHPDVRRKVEVKSVSLRGIGEAELVWVWGEEFKNLPKAEKALLRKP